MLAYQRKTGGSRERHGSSDAPAHSSPVHSASEKVSSLHDAVTKHFILADCEEQECTRTVVFAVFTSCYACHWTQVTQVWDIFDFCGGEKWSVIYHNNQRLRHHKAPVHHGDFFACYERSDSNTPFQADRTVSDSEAPLSTYLGRLGGEWPIPQSHQPACTENHNL